MLFSRGSDRPRVAAGRERTARNEAAHVLGDMGRAIAILAVPRVVSASGAGAYVTLG